MDICVSVLYYESGMFCAFPSISNEKMLSQHPFTIHTKSASGLFFILFFGYFLILFLIFLAHTHTHTDEYINFLRKKLTLFTFEKRKRAEKIWNTHKKYTSTFCCVHMEQENEEKKIWIVFEKRERGREKVKSERTKSAPRHISFGIAFVRFSLRFAVFAGGDDNDIFFIQLHCWCR